MSLADCLGKINKGKPVFNPKEIDELNALVRENLKTMPQEQAEKAAVQTLLDEAVAERKQIDALAREALPAVEETPVIEEPVEPTVKNELYQEARTERRESKEERRQRYKNMSPDEYVDELERRDVVERTSYLTGLPNRLMYDEKDRKAIQASADIDGLKGVNDTLGHAAGDSLIRAKADALKAAKAGEPSIEVYHISGDEFVAEADTVEEIDRVMNAARKELMENGFTYVAADGTTQTKKGIGFSYGTDKTLEQADANLKDDKEARKTAGLRTGERDVATRDAGTEAERTGAGNERDGRTTSEGVSGRSVNEDGSLVERRTVKEFNQSAQEKSAHFYSQLSKAIEGAPAKVFTTGKQVSQWIESNQSNLGIKSDEIFWSGINDFLAIASSPVTKNSNASTIKNLRDIAATYTEMLGDFGAINSGVVHLNSGIEIPSNISGAYSIAVNRVATDPKNLSDLRSFISGGGKGFSLLDVDSKRVVMTAVRFAAHDLKIFKSIVDLVPVDMVNILVGSESAPDVLLNNPSMLKGIPAIDMDAPVSTLMDRAFESLVSNRAFPIAEVIKSSTIAARGAAENLAAMIASNIHNQDEYKDNRYAPYQNINKQSNKVTKADVLAYLDANGVQIKVEMLGDGGERLLTAEDVEITEDGAEFWEALVPGQSRIIGKKHYPTKDAAIDFALKYFNGHIKTRNEENNKTKFASYQLPGGTNYKEMLLTMPEQSDPAHVITKRKNIFSEYKQRIDALQEKAYGYTGINGTIEDRDAARADYSKLQDERNAKADAVAPLKADAPKFKSSHFDQPNILAHIRFNERIDADGAKVLFIEEIQSDWGQKGKNEGFGEKDQWQVISTKNGKSWGYYATESDANNIASRIKDDAVEIKKTGNKNKGVPSAPFVQNTKAWTALALKRIIAHAVDNGFSKVAWTTGEQQSARYDLSKQVDGVEWAKYSDTKVDIFFQKRGNEGKEKAGRFTIAELEGVIGKDLAKKVSEEFSSGKVNGEYSGLDLKVGGEGMKGFYDQIVPHVASKIIEKFGDGKVEAVGITLPGGIGQWEYQGPELSIKELLEISGDINTTASIERQLNAVAGRVKAGESMKEAIEREGSYGAAAAIGGKLVEKTDKPTQQGFTITPEMRNEIMAKGMPLFQENLGSFDPESNTITLLEGANLSTALHELSHWFLSSDIADASELVQKEFLTKGELKVVEEMHNLFNFYGLPGDLNEQLRAWHSARFEQQKEMHETFAESFEMYLLKGKAPSIELQSLFQSFSGFMLSVYKSAKELLRRNPRAGKLNPELTRYFDRMLATEEQIELAERSRSMMPLFEDLEKSGLSPEAFARYQEQGKQTSQAAIEELRSKAVSDLGWIRGAYGKEVAKLQKKAKEARREVRIDAHRDVMTQPISIAWRFLTKRLTADDKIYPVKTPKSDYVDETVDSLFVAIAKLGGIDKDETIATWGTDKADKPASGKFGKPVWRIEGGRSLDAMAEVLGQYGYLERDEDGKVDLHQFKEMFAAELKGDTQHSIAFEYKSETMAGDQVKNPQALGAARIDMGDLLKMGLPDEIVEKLKANGMTAQTGLAPDLIAEIQGFESGDELMRALAGALSPSVMIEKITDQRMIEQHGELSSQEQISQAADVAIHNKVRAKMITTEINAMAVASGNKKLELNAAKILVANQIADIKIRDLRPSMYANAAARAGKLAEKAFKKGDRAVVYAEKRNQLINTLAAQAAYDAKAEFEKTDALFKKIVTGKDDVVGKTRDMDIVNEVRAVLAEYGYQGKATKAGEYLKLVEANDPGLYEVLIQSVNAARESSKPIKDVTIAELAVLKVEIEMLWHMAKSSRMMEIDGKMMNREIIAAELLARMTEIGIPDSMPGDTSAPTAKEQRANNFAQVGATMRRVESWVDAKDGSNKMGAFRKYIWNPIKDAADSYRADKVKYLRGFRDAFSAVAPSMKRELISAPEIGYTFGKDSGGVAMNELLHAILHTGNESNKRKMLLGRNWATENQDGTLNTQNWDAFISRMIKDGKITKAHYDFAQQVWDLLETTKPLAQKTYRAAYGKYFEEVIASPVVTPFGTYEGGYLPAMVDSRIVKDADLKKLIEEGKEGMAYAFPTPGKGFTKSRVEYNRPLMLDLRTLPQHIDKVLLFSHMEIPSRDVAKLISNKDISSALNKISPAAINGILIPWLSRASRQQVTTPVPGAAFMMSMANTIRNRSSMALMFANVSNSAQQLTGFSLASLKVKPSSLASAGAEYLKNPRLMSRTMTELSKYMDGRISNEVAAMTSEISDILIDPTLLQKGDAWTKKHTYFMQSAVDSVMSTVIWTAAYNEALAENYDEKNAVRIADAVIRQTQGSSLPEDVSRIETGPAYARLFTQFYGYFNMQANLLGTEFHKMPKDMGLRKNMGRGLYVTVAGFYAPAVVATLIAELFRGGPDDEDKDGEYLDDWMMSVFGFGVIRNATAFVPVLGQAINSAVARFNSNPIDDRMSLSPAISLIEGSAGVPYHLYKMAVDEGNAQRTVKDVATLISVTTGLPASAAARPIGYIAGEMQGKIEPTSEVDMIRGLISGVASKESRVN